jgi:superoxide reductase
MDRRAFIKGTVLTAAVVASGKAFSSGRAYASEEKTEGMHRLENRDNPSVLEQKHVPGIEAPEKATKGEWFDVTVKVGYMQEHPSAPDHWITFVSLLANGQEVAKTERPVGGVSASSATFRIKLEGDTKLEAVDNCNIHGTWIGEPVTVSVS